MDHVPAPFVLAGINVKNCGFFTGHRGAQLARRYTTMKASPSDYTTIAQRKEWTLLAEGFERALRLHAHISASMTTGRGARHRWGSPIPPHGTPSKIPFIDITDSCEPSAA
jgi:hypothetical protein